MIDGFDSTAITVSQAALSLLFGTMIGLLLGLVGGGGSILTVPILVYVIGLDVRAATATSLAIVGTSALAGAIPTPTPVASTATWPSASLASRERSPAPGSITSSTVPGSCSCSVS